MMYRGVYGQIIEDTINKASHGDTYAAKKLMEEFCDAIKMYTGKDGKTLRTPSGAGIQIDDRILRYFGECFGQILEIERTTQQKKGEKAKKVYDALHLKRYTAQADPSRRMREIDISNEVTALLDSGVAQIDAFGLVAGKCYPEDNTDTLSGSFTPVVYLAKACYPKYGGPNAKGLKATKEAYYRYNQTSLVNKVIKQIQQEKDQQ